MLRKHLARLLAFVLVLNLVLSAPLSVGAEVTFDADPVAVATTTEEGSTQTAVVVTETVPKSTVGTETSSTVTVENQTVSVEIPVEEATTLTPVEDTLEANGDNTAIEYDTPAEGSTDETVHVEESYDLKVEVTDADTDANGKLTDIEYDVSLEQKVSEPSDSETPAPQSSEDNSDPKTDAHWKNPVKVNLSVNGMEDEEITRVEHKYTDESGTEQTEYYYNAKQV